MHKVYLYITMVLLLVTFAEVVSYVFLESFFYERYPRFFRYDFSEYDKSIPDSYLEKFASIYDAELGWDYKPFQSGGSPETGCQGRPWQYSLDEIGSRDIADNAGISNKAALISLYGGSYTFGAEVRNDETWQYHLSARTGENIYNFGVGGWGLDQALLKLERNIKKGYITPIVIFGAYSDGISRILNSFRPFRTQNSEGITLGFKPRLIQKGREFVWEPNPLTSIDRDVIKTALEKSKKTDYFFEQNKTMPKLTFPYLFVIGKLAQSNAWRLSSNNRSLWNEPLQGRPVMNEVIRRYTDLAEQHHFTPMIVFLPSLGDLERYKRGRESQYKDFIEQLDFDDKNLVIVDVYEEEFDPTAFSLAGCHPSSYGNEITAEAIYQRMLELNLLPSEN